MVSNCCGATRWLGETDICSECKEHADFIYYCVECFKTLEQGHICDPCQNLISNLPDIEKENDEISKNS